MLRTLSLDGKFKTDKYGKSYKSKGNIRMKTYVCKKIWLYEYLSNRGFVFYKACRDKFNPKHTVWLYDWSEELENAVNEYYDAHNRSLG